MKKCPFCAEEILDEALKCKHCGEFLDRAEKTEWYFRNSTVITAFVCVGPLALPLVWWNPRYSRNTKLVLTAVTLLLTWALSIALSHSVKALMRYYQDMNAMLNP